MRRCGTGRGGAAHGIIHDCGTRCSTKPAGRSRGSNRCASSFPTTTAISLPASSISPQLCAPRAEITVVAPERDRSGASNSLTLDRPLSVRRAPNGFLFVNGTPTDCVHLAVTGLLDDLPDMVISGINLGANMGDDTVYSGTVAAATEGYLLGVPSVAISLASKTAAHFETAAAVALELLERHQRQTAGPWLLNVNVPDVPRWR